MHVPDDPRRALDWLMERGLDERDLMGLNPCVPGEFTLLDTYYVNTATPGMVYHASGEGTLPPVVGRWYLIPAGIIARNPALIQETARVARAVRLSRGT